MGDREDRAEQRRRTWRAFVSREGVHPPMWRMEPEVALAAMWEAALDAWLLSGRELPSYARHEMPGRILRLGEKR